MSDEGDVPDAAAAGTGSADEVDFLVEMRARLSDRRSRRILERLDILEGVYVECGRDKVLKETFERFMLSFLTAKPGRRKEAGIFFMTGPSGAGKTAAIERVLREHPVLQPQQKSFGVVRPYVSVTLTGYVIPRLLAETIMRGAGARIGKVGRGDAWYQLPGELQKRRVGFVHIDEFNHLIPREGKDNRIEELADALKGASISPLHPIAFILSGLPQITRLPIQDDQVERRNWIVDFPDLRLPGERKLVVRILKTMAAAVGMDVGIMPDTDMPERMAHAGRNRFARVCQGVTAAIQQALHVDPDATELTRHHFAMAYADRSLTRGHNERNPFLSDDWANLPPGSFLGRIEDEET